MPYRFWSTQVLCNASIDERVPPFLKNTGSGWVTAEYGMLPRSTHTRTDREAARGKQSGRTQEIQRLIGRSLRAVVDLPALGERQIKIDCDVLQADGGTRTVGITGAYVALHLACRHLVKKKLLRDIPIKAQVAALSAGFLEKQAVLDLDYQEDSQADVDANFILSSNEQLIEIQACGEKRPFEEAEFHQMLTLVKEGVSSLFEAQRKALGF